MDSSVESLRKVFARDRGVIGRLEWLNSDGTYAYGSEEQLFIELLVDRRRVAWIAAGELRPTAQPVQSVDRDGDDWLLMLRPNMRMRLKIGPLWNQEWRDKLAEFIRTRDQQMSPGLVEDMKAFFAAL